MASEMVELAELDASLQQQVENTQAFAGQFGEKEDVIKAQDLASNLQRFRTLAQSADPATRSAALQQLQAVDQAAQAQKIDLVGRTRTKADAYTARVNAVGDQHQQRLEQLQDSMVKRKERFNNALGMVNAFKDDTDNPAFQISVREILQGTMREMGQDAFNVSLAPLGIGFSKEFGDKKFTYDEAMKIITTSQRAQMEILGKQLKSQTELMQAQGYVIGLTEDGGVSVRHSNNIASDFLNTPAPGDNRPPTVSPVNPALMPGEASGQDIAQKVGDATETAGGFVKGFLSPALGAFGSAVGDTSEAIKSNIGATVDATAEGIKFTTDAIEEHYQNNARRAELRRAERERRARPTN
jgi:hypothetical protein